MEDSSPPNASPSGLHSFEDPHNSADSEHWSLHSSPVRTRLIQSLDGPPSFTNSVSESSYILRSENDGTAKYDASMRQGPRAVPDKQGHMSAYPVSFALFWFYNTFC